MICFSVSVVGILIARKANSSTLFSSMRRKVCQYPGMELDDSTHLQMPLPLFFLVSVFKLSGKYSSQTISTRVICCSWDVMYSKNTCDACSEKVFALPGVSMSTITAPSRIMTLTGGLAAAFSRGGIRSYNHLTRSHFFPSLIVPICDNAGGPAV